MTTIYKNEEAKKVCKMILDNFPFYTLPLEGYDRLSAGYWKEDGKWIAYDNTYGQCRGEEFKTRKEAIAYVKDEMQEV